MRQLTANVFVETGLKGANHGLVTTSDGRGGIGRGMNKEDCVANLTAMTDRYPMDVGQDGMAPHVMRLNVANLYDCLTGAGIHKRG